MSIAFKKYIWKAEFGKNDGNKRVKFIRDVVQTKSICEMIQTSNCHCAVIFGSIEFIFINKPYPISISFNQYIWKLVQEIRIMKKSVPSAYEIM